MSQTDSLRNFTVGEIDVSPQHNTLRRQTQSITVQPKVMAVLIYLAQHQTRVVGNEELLQAVWQGRIVTLASVQKSINALRSALAELVGSQECVAYFSKRGYQLLLPVAWSEPHPAVPTSAPVLPNNNSTAVVDTNSQALPDGNAQILADSNLSVRIEPAPEPPLAAIQEIKEIKEKKELKEIANLQPAVKRPLNLPRSALVGVVVIAALLALIVIARPYLARPNAPGLEAANPLIAKLPIPQSASAPRWQSQSTYLPAANNAHHATPSPDGKRAAYLRESDAADGAHLSDLMIRDHSGLDWLLSRSNSTWVDLAWSPSGRALAALEIYRADGLFSDPDFYQTPQYLYNFHLFTLDLKGQHLLEKNLLSQWQGKVNSITWWDENTLEFVATLGASATKERYRYGVTDQTLSALGAPPSGYQPLISRVRNKITALISRQQDSTQVEFLDEQQNLLGKHTIDSSIHDLSWAPDSRAVFALDTRRNQIYHFPINGEPSAELLPSPLREMPGDALGDLKIDSSGKSLFITANTQTAQLFQFGARGLQHLADINGFAKNSLVYSPEGDAIIYATHQNNQAQLWLLKNNQTVALYKTDGTIQSVLWPLADTLIIKANNKLARYHLQTHAWDSVMDEAQDADPLDYSPDAQALLVVKLKNDVRNIWRINIATRQQKQLTFGEVGTVRSTNNNVYFQYANQPGLWQLNTQDPNHTVINEKLPQHSQLIGISGKAIYFVTGGPCHESDIQQLDLARNTLSTYLKRPDTNVVSIGFSLQQGVLQTACKPNAFTIYDVRSE